MMARSHRCCQAWPGKVALAQPFPSRHHCCPYNHGEMPQDNTQHTLPTAAISDKGAKAKNLQPTSRVQGTNKEYLVGHRTRIGGQQQRPSWERGSERGINTPLQCLSRQGCPPPSKSKASQAMWARQKDMVLKQALQAQAQVLLHMNKKHNDTFFMAPGETTHITMMTVFGYLYHVHTVLMKAECPSNYTDNLRAMTTKDCKSQPESPKIECNFEVTELLGIGFYITGEECHEYTPPPSKGDNNPDKSAADPTDPQSQEDEGGSYV